MTHPGRIVRTTATVVGLTYAVALYLSGVHLNGQLKHVLSYLSTFLTFLIVIFDKWVWKWPWALKFHRQPRLDGLWRVTLEPDPESHIPQGGNRGSISGYLVIEQSFWSITVTQLTVESTSYSQAESFLRQAESSKTSLVFVYDNTPRREHLKRSPRHCGGCALSVALGAPTNMSGSYFTDRFTAGAMVAQLVDRTTNYAEFTQAHEHARD